MGYRLPQVLLYINDLGF